LREDARKLGAGKRTVDLACDADLIIAAHLSIVPVRRIFFWRRSTP
jgi:hypothetical protein